MSSNNQNSDRTSRRSTDGQNMKQRSLQSVIPDPTPSSDGTESTERTASTDRMKSASRDSSPQPSSGQHLAVYIYPNQMSRPEQSSPSAPNPAIQPIRQQVPQEPQRPAQTQSYQPYQPSTQYHGQPTPQYQTQPIPQTHHQQWQQPVHQPLQPIYPVHTQSPTLLVSQPLPDPDAESKRKCYNVLRVLQLIICTIGLLGLSALIIYYWTVDVDSDEGLSDNDKSERRVGRILGLMILLTITICGLIGAGGEVLCCQVTHAVFTFWALPYSPITITLAVGMCNGWAQP